MSTTIVTEQPVVLAYVASAGQTVFPFGFQIFNGFEDFVVRINGVETNAYTYDLLGDEGGNLILDNPSSNLDSVVIIRRLAIERITQFPSAGPVAMESVNDELNRIVALIQQIANGSYASITIGTVTTGAPGTNVFVENVGTSTAAILNFTIPRGTPGTPGSVGNWGGLNGSLSDQADLWALLVALDTAVDADAAAIATLQGQVAALEATRTVIVPINANAMVPRTTNGAAAGTTETTTNKVMCSTLDFDAGTSEFAQVAIPMPNCWNEGTFDIQLGWSATATGNVKWGASAMVLRDDSPLDTAFGTPQYVTDGVTLAGDLMITPYTAAITAAGTPQQGDMLVIQINREAADGADTCAVDARLHFIRVRMYVNARDDA